MILERTNGAMVAINVDFSRAARCRLLCMTEEKRCPQTELRNNHCKRDTADLASWIADANLDHGRRSRVALSTEGPDMYSLRHPKCNPRLESHCPLLPCPCLVFGFPDVCELPLACGGRAPANWIPISGCQMPPEMLLDPELKGGGTAALCGVGAVNGSSGRALILYDNLDSS